MISMFAKANYTYDRRYLIEGTVRRDGSSRFGDGEKFGVFPSIAAGWNVHEEKFMKSLKNEINELKLRASYGLLGNENIGLYKYQTFIDMGNGEEKEYGNPEITWEKVKMLNIGADIRLFKDLSLTFDWYEKRLQECLLLLLFLLSVVLGQLLLTLEKYVTEVGNLVQITTNSLKTLASVFMAACLKIKNKIIDLFGAPYDNGSTINQIGYALNSYYVYPTDGLLQESDFTKDDSGKWIPKEE